MLIRSPHSKEKWKTCILAIESSNQQTLGFKQDFSRICANDLSPLARSSLTCKWPDPQWRLKVINYRLIEGISHTLNEWLFLPYCKLYNKCIYKKVYIFPLRSNTKNYSHLKALYYQSLYRKNSPRSHRCHFIKNHFSKPNSFMHVFNVSILYMQHIELHHQKLW